MNYPAGRVSGEMSETLFQVKETYVSLSSLKRGTRPEAASVRVAGGRITLTADP